MIRKSVSILLLTLLGLMIARPVTAAGRLEIDVILLVDTSNSMNDELEALCDGIDDLSSNLEQRGITAHVTVLGIAETRACATKHVSQILPDVQAHGKEDWGAAVADLARYYAWTPDAVRLIVPLSDEGPMQGDPVNDEDENVIQTAIRAARANQVIVSPALGTQYNPKVEPLARELAQETGGRVLISQDPDQDLVEGLRGLTLDATRHARVTPSLLKSIPTPRDVLSESGALLTNLVLAVLLTLILGLATSILSNILRANQSTLASSRPGRALAALARLEQRAGRLLLARLNSRPLLLLQVALFLLLMGLVGVFLQPGLSPFSWQGLALWVGLWLALALVNLIYGGSQSWLLGRGRVTPIAQLQPGSALLALAAVALSRLVGFTPGYFYGQVTRYTLPNAQTNRQPTDQTNPPPSHRHQVKNILAVLAVLAAVGLTLWILTLPTALLRDGIAKLALPQALDTLGGGLVGALHGFFALGFFVAWQTLFFELLPLPFTNGGLLYQRRSLIWAVPHALVLFVLLHTLVNPFGAGEQLLQSRGLLLLLFLAFLYSALAVGVWVTVALRTSGKVTADWNRSQRIPIMAIGLVALWTLGFCAWLVRLLVGWIR
jgi:hypothetical protein